MSAVGVLAIIATATAGKPTAEAGPSLAPGTSAASQTLGGPPTTEKARKKLREAAPPRNDPRITMAEWSALKEGMSVDEVTAIVGAPGEVISSSEIADIKTIMVQWRGNTLMGNANAMFQNGRLVTKAQFGLE